VTRADWRPEQVRVIDQCICGTIKGLGINILPKEEAEKRRSPGREANLGGEDASAVA
jgi:hypothetical protein